jgi:hypothetical protein
MERGIGERRFLEGSEDCCNTAGQQRRHVKKGVGSLSCGKRSDSPLPSHVPQHPPCALVSPAPKESVPPTIFMCIVVLRCFNTLAKYEMNKEIRFR